MKYKHFFCFVILFALFTACKDEEKKAVEQVATEVEASNKFVVTLNAVIKQDDSFQLYYKNEESGNYEEANSIFTEMKGSDKPQDVVFTLPEDVLPSYFRLDFGTNKNQSPIVINSLKFDYLDKNFNLSGSQFFDYFILNELTVKGDKATSTITPILNPDGVHDPMSYSGTILAEEIKKIIQ